MKRKQDKINSIKIAMIIYRFPPSFAGGARHAIELSKGLKRFGINSFFIAANLAKAPAFEIFEGFPVYRFLAKDGRRYGYLHYALSICKKIMKERKTLSIVHLHSVAPFYFLIFLLTRILSLPIVISPTLIGHDDPLSLKTKSLLWRFEGILYKYYDSIICKSTAVKESCIQAGIPSSKIVMIPCAIPCGLPNHPFQPVDNYREKLELRHKLNLPKNAFIIIFIGRIQYRKGIDLLFETWELLLAEGFEGYLALVGPYNLNGNENDILLKKLRYLINNKEHKKLIFTGETDYKFIPQYLKASDCFIFPSRRESFGKAVVEAMACGLPVICTLIPGVTTDIIENGVNGIIIEKKNPGELAKAIKRLYDDREFKNRIRKNALEKVEMHFGIDKIVLAHYNLYKKLVKK